MPDREHPYVSRGGVKLRHALDAFGVDVTGLACADLGCSTGGFTDCLLQGGAASVVSVDTGYGVLAWKLRQDPRVTVIERANALHVDPPEAGVDLVVIDMGWTPQRLCIPAALKWLRPELAQTAARRRGRGGIITLIKPHYERSAAEPGSVPRGGILTEAEAEATFAATLKQLPALGVRVVATTRSPILGSRARKQGEGNIEFFALLEEALSGSGG